MWGTGMSGRQGGVRRARGEVPKQETRIIRPAGVFDVNNSTVLRCARWAVRFIYCAGAWRVDGVSRWCVYSMGVRGLLSKP